MVESSINESRAVKKYPCLKINEEGDKVVLFTSAKQGTVVGGYSTHHPVGHHSAGWAEDNFKDFNGSITLQNA